MIKGFNKGQRLLSYLDPLSVRHAKVRFWPNADMSVTDPKETLFWLAEPFLGENITE